MAQLDKPDLPPGPVRDLIDELHALHARAGWPSARELALGQQFSYNTVHHLFAGQRVPKLPVLLAVVDTLARMAPRVDRESTLARFDELWDKALHAENERSELEWIRPAAPSGGPEQGEVEVARDGDMIAIRNAQKPGLVLRLTRTAVEHLIDWI